MLFSSSVKVMHEQINLASLKMSKTYFEETVLHRMNK